MIETNVRLNAPAAALTVEHGAIDYSGKAEVHLTLGKSNIDASVQKNGARTAVAPALTLSRLAARHGLGEFAVVCDIEGAEAAMIRDDAAALAKCWQLIIELHRTPEATVEDMVRAIRALGFSLTARHGVVCVFER